MPILMIDLLFLIISLMKICGSGLLIFLRYGDIFFSYPFVPDDDGMYDDFHEAVFFFFFLLNIFIRYMPISCSFHKERIGK